jgi:hypothetical protein
VITQTKALALVRVDLDAKVCRRYVGRSETHGFAFDDESKITPETVEAMRSFPDTVGSVAAAA